MNKLCIIFLRTISGIYFYRGEENEEKEILFQIALDNSQVRYILRDLDVETFYRKLLKSMKTMTSNAQEVKDILESDD